MTTQRPICGAAARPGRGETRSPSPVKGLPRRLLVRLLLAALALVAAAACDQQTASSPPPLAERAWPPPGAANASAGWPRLLGPRRDGVSAETGLLHVWPDAGPDVLWETSSGSGYGSPVVVSGRLVFQDRLGEVERVRCLDPRTGEPLWTQTYPTSYTDRFGHYSDGPYSTPLIEDDRVYTLGAQGQLHCWALADGALLWRRPLHQDYEVPQGLFPVAASPFIDGDVLVFNLGAVGQQAGVIGLDKRTGATLWEATEEPASCATPIAAAIHGRRHLIVFGNRSLISLDPSSGEELWRRKHYCKSPDSANATSPVVVGDLVLAVCGPGPGSLCMRVLSDGTAEPLWSDRRVLDSQFNSLVVVDGFVYGFSTKRQGGALLKCVEVATGKEQWSLASDLGRGQALAADGVLFVVGEEGHLASVAVNPGRAELLCITPEPILKGPCYASPALYEGRLYVKNEHRLVCYDLRGSPPAP